MSPFGGEISESTKEMNKRFYQKLEKIPDCDLEDVKLERQEDQRNAVKFQFAPQFTQEAYQAMLLQQICVGDFTRRLEDASDSRSHMIILIFELRVLKNYK